MYLFTVGSVQKLGEVSARNGGRLLTSKGHIYSDE